MPVPVRMRVLVRQFRFVHVAVFVRVRITDVELRRRDTRAQHALRGQRTAVDGQAAERALEARRSADRDRAARRAPCRRTRRKNNRCRQSFARRPQPSPAAINRQSTNPDRQSAIRSPHQINLPPSCCSTARSARITWSSTSIPISTPGRDQPVRQHDVFRARLRIAGGMVVEHDDRRGAAGRGLPEDLAGMHDARVERADRHHGRPHHAMLRVEQHDAELFDRRGCRRAAAAVPRRSRGVVICTRCRPARVSVRRPSSTAASTCAARAAPMPEMRVSSSGCARASPSTPPTLASTLFARSSALALRLPVAEDDRHQLVVAERRGAEALQLLARPIVRRDRLHRTPSRRCYTLPALMRRPASCLLCAHRACRARACVPNPRRRRSIARRAPSTPRAPPAPNATRRPSSPPRRPPSSRRTTPSRSATTASRSRARSTRASARSRPRGRPPTARRASRSEAEAR